MKKNVQNAFKLINKDTKKARQSLATPFLKENII